MNCENVGNYIFIQDLFESKKFCNFMEEILPISNFDFGKSPQADNCFSTFKCFYNVNINEVDLSSSEFWFLANLKSVLWTFYSNPVDVESLENLVNS